MRFYARIQTLALSPVFVSLGRSELQRSISFLYFMIIVSKILNTCLFFTIIFTIIIELQGGRGGGSINYFFRADAEINAKNKPSRSLISIFHSLKKMV